MTKLGGLPSSQRARCALCGGLGVWPKITFVRMLRRRWPQRVWSPALKHKERTRLVGTLPHLHVLRANHCRPTLLFAFHTHRLPTQVLEDINPTDDELRESQQRVRLPKREATIGEAAGRPGSSTAGVIGGWLGAAATVGLSTASAGLSTVTGVAGATASAGLSTVTGVAGAMAGRASGAVTGGGGAGKDGGDAGRESGPVPASDGGGASGAVATEATGENRSPVFGPVPNSVVRGGGGGGDGRGHAGVEELEGGESGVLSRGVPPVAGVGEFGAGRGGIVGAGNDQLEEVDVQVRFCALRGVLFARGVGDDCCNGVVVCFKGCS